MGPFPLIRMIKAYQCKYVYVYIMYIQERGNMCHFSKFQLVTLGTPPLRSPTIPDQTVAHPNPLPQPCGPHPNTTLQQGWPLLEDCLEILEDGPGNWIRNSRALPGWLPGQTGIGGPPRWIIKQPGPGASVWKCCGAR